MASNYQHDLARKIHEAARVLGDLIEEFREAGGRTAMRVWHSGGCEGDDLHDLSGELQPETVVAEVLEPAFVCPGCGALRCEPGSCKHGKRSG